MAKEKVTISLDRAKANRVRTLLSASSTSEAIDRALDRLIAAEQLRRDVAAYRKIPPDPAEAALALLGDTTGLTDETDWEALYLEDEDGG